VGTLSNDAYFSKGRQQMIRDYTGGIKENVDYFVGTEVEHTPAYGKRTLFVVGIKTAESIKAIANEAKCKHIYCGANMSFNVTENTQEQWGPWEEMIHPLLEQGFLVTLDVDVSQVEGLLETILIENNCFIPMISVKLPHIQLLGYNACIKLDDKDFNASNPGVWVHSVHNLMDKDCFTPWDKYKDDSII
jgi:hypothetical protein